MYVWKKKGEGPSYKGTYTRDSKGERVFVLFRVTNRGTVHSVTAESAAMAKRAGWVRLKSK